MNSKLHSLSLGIGLIAACMLATVEFVEAQTSDTGVAPLVLKAEPISDEPLPPPKKEVKPDLKATWQTQKEARTLILTIPAPRGQIVDRNGVPLAQNRVVYQLALNFPFMKDATTAQILAFAHEQIAKANQMLGKAWTLNDDDMVQHYHNRRWLPLVFSIEDGLNVELSNDEQEKIKPLIGQGLVLQPAYQRYYPRQDTACHIIGYAGKTRRLPTGPIAEGDPMFEELEGREGLELTFESDLKGTPGSVNILFSPDGKRLSEETLRRPVPGRNVVTSIDYNIQKYCENALKKGARNGGAFVIMDIRTGDILAMASNPGYDLNQFIPGIHPEAYKKLLEDKKLPLFARGFRGQYPPASTFKIVTALGALNSTKVTSRTSYDCSNALAIGDRVFRNWNKNGEGPMNVITAIKRSCNTWFYQAAVAAGSDSILNMALHMGFGERTGIPLNAEAAGFVPTNAYMIQHEGHKLSQGDLANISIGQGRVLATPLQVCQCMAALADGVEMKQPRLVRQVQDVSDRVVMATEVTVKRRVDLNADDRSSVVNGMVAVVSGDNGTGRAADIKYAQIAGKTGTAQWKPSEDRNLAWFTGFLPANNPVYAFAVVYEGSPGETISGGKIAAPMVAEVFENIFQKASPDDPLVLAMKDIPKAMEVDEGDQDAVEGGDVPTAQPVEEVAPAQPADQPKKGIKGFFKKLFGN